jgi:hypothetical protein
MSIAAWIIAGIALGWIGSLTAGVINLTLHRNRNVVRRR